MEGEVLNRGAVDHLRARFKAFFEKDRLMASILPMAGKLEKAKFSRGRLLMKVAKENQIDIETASEAALGIEMVHMATLVHDDIIDDAEMRRGESSFRSKVGDKAAILFGDYLFSTAIDQIQQSQTEGCSKLFTKRVHDTCRGESIQDLLLVSAESDLSLDLLHEVARGKTGALFAFCTEAPLWMNREFSMVVKKAAREIGFLSGLAYQLADDILDITGEENNLGKPVCNDLLKNCMTTPLYLLMSELKLNWQTLRSRFFNKTDEFSKMFIDSESFHKVKFQIDDIREKILENLDIVEREGVVLREIIDEFWKHYVFKRMELMKDIALTR